jgi:hypothetical protein
MSSRRSKSANTFVHAGGAISLVLGTVVRASGDGRSLKCGARVRRRVMRELHVTVDGTKFGGKQPGDCAVDIDRSSRWAMVAA